MKKLTASRALLLILFIASIVFSCKKKELEVISGFTYTVDAADFRKATFKNASQNAAKVSWNFGDNTAASTENDPTHIYAGAGEFTVQLTASSEDGKVTDIATQKVVIADKNAQLTALAGSLNKVWKLNRDVATKRYPLQVGPIDRSQIWWAVGNQEPLYKRACMLNDEYTFGRDGSYKYDSKGDTWGEKGTFKNADVCTPTTAAGLVGPNGEDLSKWGDGNHKFRLNAGAKPTLTVLGKGAFIGLQKVGTNLEYKAPQDSVTYNIIKLTDGVVDTLILESEYKFNATDATNGGYWRFVLVHYDDSSKEPAIPGPTPEPGFTSSVSGLTATFTNTSKFATSYLWDFGDGKTSSAQSPSNTYASSGFYTVKLTATSSTGSATSTTEIFASTSVLTDAALQGDVWKIRADVNSIVVGPGLGNGTWYGVPKESLTGMKTGADDWSCIANDEFSFNAGGVYKYDTKGDARNDGYFGSPNGCWSDALVAASGNGSAFKTATHTYKFSPATGGSRAKITVTNGASGSAFVGFYKAFNGGENADKTKAPNNGATSVTYEVMGYAKGATKEYLFISCDTSPKLDGSSSWSMVLVR